MAVSPVEEQRFSALQVANQYRLTVARERRRIAALSHREGCRALADLIETTVCPAVQSGKVSQYLRAVRRLGDVQVPRLIKRIGVTDPNRRLRDLTYRQKTVLIEELRRLS